jgi:hypothetical protein
MAKSSTATLTIAFNDPQLDQEEKEEEVQKLLKQMKQLKEVESVERVLDPNPPIGNKSFSAFLVGLLTAEVSPANIKKLFQFLTDRLGNKSIKMKVKASDGKELEIEASSREEFEVAMQKAQDFFQI